MSQSKREQVVSHLRYIRQELREMHQGVMDDGLLPEAGEVRGVMAQMEALLELLQGGQHEARGPGCTQGSTINHNDWLEQEQEPLTHYIRTESPAWTYL